MEIPWAGVTPGIPPPNPSGRSEEEPSPLGIVGRILAVAYQLERQANRQLAAYDLSLWQMDVLVALRRAGPPHAMTPTELTRAVSLSSAAMTNRIDRLEEVGLVTRSRHPADRRGVIISLTDQGQDVADYVTAPRQEEAREALAPLSEEQMRILADALALLQNHLSSRNRRRAGTTDGRGSRGRRRAALVAAFGPGGGKSAPSAESGAAAKGGGQDGVL